VAFSAEGGRPGQVAVFGRHIIKWSIGPPIHQEADTMFEVLFIYPKVLARRRAGLAAADRGRYLAHCAGQSAAHGTLLAHELLVIAERIDATVRKSVPDRRSPPPGHGPVSRSGGAAR
jgi:hypothetical protein